MKRLVTAAQMAALEQASARHQVSTQQLMEHAGAALASEAQRLAAGTGRFLILCGRGNNGGDGLVAARCLRALGREVHCELLPGDDAKLPAEAFQALKGCGFVPSPVELEPAPGDVVIDALLGTGLSRAPAGDYAGAIERISAWRRQGALVLAADLPSGLRADTGEPFRPCVEADATVTFGHQKVGLALEPGATLAGAVTVADIGLPPEAAQGVSGAQTFELEEADAVGRLSPRRSDTHKGTYGHLLVIAGSPGKTGAAALTAKAALRAGAGLVTVATRGDALAAVLAHAPEVMGQPLRGDAPLGPDDLEPLLEAARGKTALVIGPGLLRGEGTAALLRSLFEQLPLPMVLDADGLNAIGDQRAFWSGLGARLVLTPHPGEMGRLLGRGTAQVQQDRLGAARELASLGGVTVLKGARTVIAAPDGTAWINPTGNPGMASGGTGDALSGMIGALLAQGLTPVDAALVGTYAHGLAGDLAARRVGQLGMIASDLIESLGEVWTRWGR